MNLTVEKEILRSLSMSASYVGALGRKLPASIDRNYPVFGPGATTANVNARRPYQPGVIGTGARARIDLQQRLSRPAVECRTAGHPLLCQSLLHAWKGPRGRRLPGWRSSRGAELQPPDLERGRTSADRTHSFMFSGVWQLDYFESATPVVKALLNGWTVSAIVTLQSGTPLTITSGQDRNFDGLTNDRADIIGDPSSTPGVPREELIEEWFNTRPSLSRPSVRMELPPQHPRGSRLSERRSRCVPRHSPAWPHGAAAASGSHERVQHRQPAESGREPQRSGDVWQDSLGARHAEDPAGCSSLLLARDSLESGAHATRRPRRPRRNPKEPFVCFVLH